MKNLIVLFIGLATALSSLDGQTHETKSIDLDEIHSIGLSVDANLIIREGKTQDIKIKGPTNLIDDINIEVNGQSWNIKYLTQENKNVKEQLEIEIQLVSLKNLAISGTGTIETIGKFSRIDERSIAISGSGSISFVGDAEVLNIALSGVGEMKIKSNVQDMSVALSGTGNIDLSGSVHNIQMTASGSGRIGGAQLKTKNCTATISGSSTLIAGVSDHLQLISDGSGQFKYSGNPKITKKISSSSSLQRI